MHAEMHHEKTQMLDWLKQRPEIETLRVGVCDLNGILRGKLIPVDQADKALSGGLRIPQSTTSVDIWGNDIENSALVYEMGDSDGILEWTGRPIQLIDWMGKPTGMIPLWQATEQGEPFLADPRRALANVLARYKAKGLTPVVATELEFYLFDKTETTPQPPLSPVTGKRLDANAVLSVDELDHFEAFFNDVYAACAAQNIPADAAIAEGGAGQFEINLLHCDDGLKAADDAFMFKRLVKGIARKHNLSASFMAKPYAERAGNGLHIHFSVLDETGKNIFDDGSDTGSDMLRWGVAGLLNAMPQSTLIFAPHLNSYRRLQPHTHAPSIVSWGYENRHAAIRIPGGPNVARRIEHRVAGADANPYLILAVVLGAALDGIEAKQKPIDPVKGDQVPENIVYLPSDWKQAINLFEDGDTLDNVFSPVLKKLYASCKRQEQQVFATQMSSFEFNTYMETT